MAESRGETALFHPPKGMPPAPATEVPTLLSVKAEGSVLWPFQAQNTQLETRAACPMWPLADAKRRARHLASCPCPCSSQRPPLAELGTPLLLKSHSVTKAVALSKTSLLTLSWACVLFHPPYPHRLPPDASLSGRKKINLKLRGEVITT